MSRVTPDVLEAILLHRLKHYGPQRVTQIVEATSLDRRQVRAALQRLFARGLVAPGFWCLHDAQPETLAGHDAGLHAEVAAGSDFFGVASERA